MSIRARTLQAVTFAVLLVPCAAGWGQFPGHLSGSPALQTAASKVVRLVDPETCSEALLFSRPTPNDRSYWAFINDTLLERVSERGAHASAEEVEQNLRFLVAVVMKWQMGEPGTDPQNQRFASIHALAIDLMAQLSIFRNGKTLEGDERSLTAYSRGLREFSLHLDALAAQIADAYLSPLLVRLLNDLSLEYFLLEKRLFTWELAAAQNEEGGARAFLYAHIQRTAQILSGELDTPSREAEDLLDSTLDASTFIALGGAMASVDLGAGLVLVRSWVERFVLASAYTHSFFLAGYFRHCAREVQTHLETVSAQSEKAQVALTELLNRFTPLLEPVDPEQWNRVCATPGLGDTTRDGTRDFFELVVPILEAGQYEPLNLNLLKQALCRTFK